MNEGAVHKIQSIKKMRSFMDSSWIGLDTPCIVPESPDVVEVGDGAADLLVVPGGRLRLVLDHVVLHVTAKES